VAFISCTNQFTQEIFVYRYSVYNQDSIVCTDTIFFDYLSTNDSITYHYRVGEIYDGYFYTLEVGKDNRDTVSIYGMNCPVVDVKNIWVDNQLFEIKKCDFDVISSSDEETYYFFCDRYGLLIVDNYTGIGLVHTFEYDSISRRLVSEILKRKRDFGITDYTIAPPPPNPLIKD
jgi:hypothetical protein